MLFSLLLLWCAGTVFYVYRLRGNARYRSFSQYLRKSWPVFAPFNALLYLFTRPPARAAFSPADLYPQLALVEQYADAIRQEALALMANSQLVGANQQDPGYYDVGFRTFFKYGWRKFYLNWYGYEHQSAQRLCPVTLSVLRQIPQIRGAMFSMLPPHSELTLHSDPLACSLRYHFGLQVPNSPACFINVDGEARHWRDNEALIFDETYPHFVRNDTDQSRLILMCDIERPMYWPGRLFNACYSLLVKATVVPNTNEDKVGKASALFAKVAPLLAEGKVLKKSRPALYKTIKYSLNTSLLLLSLLMLHGFISLLTIWDWTWA